MKKNLISLLLAFLALPSIAQTPQNTWFDLPESSFAQISGERRIVPTKYRTLSLDLELLKANLSEAPMQFSTAVENSPVVLSIPMPDGSMLDFQVVEAPIMHPDLAARYPYIRSYAGWSRQDRTAYLRCGYTQKGFHAVVLSAKQSTVYIDAYAEGDDRHYMSYFTKDYPSQNDKDFDCLANEFHPHVEPSTNVSEALLVPDCPRRSYRLALACTGEYANFHGGTKPLVMAAFNILLTRVNAVFEREMGSTMSMIPNTDLLIFLDPASDPYSGTSAVDHAIQNQQPCDNIIGDNYYDMGHVLAKFGNGSGAAYVGNVCFTGYKAGAASAISNPLPEPRFVNIICHEIGHLLGANHVQSNNSCGRHDYSAVEPGSGSTIMSYAGICSPNVQNYSDDYFNGINLYEIKYYLTQITYCANTLAPINDQPSLVIPQNSYNIPISTPFVLTAEGADPNAEDVLTYCWEQYDNAVAPMPPLPTNNDGPAFRTLPPTTLPSRYFPNLPDLLSGIQPIWEVLPSVSRTMKFMCTIRDNHPQNGCTKTIFSPQVKFIGTAGPFVITSPNLSSVTWLGNNTATVTWDVSGTNLSPIFTSQVDVLLSIDGGLTYPYTLLTGTPNYGFAEVQVPNVPTLQARVMVKANGNIFFDVSNENFKIEVPRFELQVSQSNVVACPNETAVYALDILQLDGFNQAVQLAVSGLPVGVTATFSQNNFIPPINATLTLGNLSSLAQGNYPFTVTATGGQLTFSTNLSLTIPGEITHAPTLNTPADGTEVINLKPKLTWSSVSNAFEYYVEVSESPDFGSLFTSGITNNANFQMPIPCNEFGVYYWRVRAKNPCSQSSFSPVYAFHIGDAGCETFTAVGLPLDIPTTSGSITPTLNVPENIAIASVKANLNISHTNVGDLIARLTSPQATVLQIFNRPGVPNTATGCDGDDIVASFSDAFSSSASTFENTCAATPPAISGEFRPSNAFSGYNGQSSQGTWSLKITDSRDGDGGALNDWSLEICGVKTTPLAVLLKNELLYVPHGQSAAISSNFLQAQGNPAAEVKFTLLSLPTNGVVYLAGTPLGLGGMFTQADIDAGLVSYTHNGGSTDSDMFTFDLLDNEGNWLHAQVFHISILQNQFLANASITHALACANATNGEITVATIGGTPPYQYSLNGGTYQGSNLFGNLATGNYSIAVMDANGLMFTTASIALSSPPQLMVSASVNSNSVSAMGSGGTGSLVYSIGGAYQNDGEFSNLPNGNYTITVMDANGCMASTSATVLVNNVTASVNATASVSCFGGNNGEITATASGGNAPYQYSLNGGAYQSSNVFGSLAAGSYTITAMDVDGLMFTTSSIMLSNPPEVIVSTSVNANTITAMGNGGTGNLTYSIGGAYQSSNEFSNLPNGNYTITVMDANGCMASTSASVLVNNVVISASVTAQVSCFGGSDGEITANATGGMAPYQYSLNGGAYQSSNVFGNLAAGSYTVSTMDADGLMQTSPAIVVAAPPQLMGTATANGYTVTVAASGGTGDWKYSLDGGAFQMENSFSPVANGNHSITLQDANGCEYAFEVTVDVPALAVDGVVSQPINCPGGMDGQLTAMASGGVPPYQYSLNGSAFQSESNFANLAEGDYTLTIKDSGGFTVSSSSVLLVAPSALVVNADIAAQMVTITASGGIPPYQFQLDGGQLQSNNIFDGVLVGTHTATVVDANGCQQMLEVWIGVLAPNIFVLQSQLLACFGGMDAALTVNASGGIEPYQYSLNGGPYQSSNVFTGLAAGSYTVTVMGADGGMTTSSSIAINEPPALSVSASAYGFAVTAMGMGGTGIYLYSMDGVNFGPENEFEVIENGSYAITIQDENGCTASSVVTVDAITGGEFLSIGIECYGNSSGQFSVISIQGGVPPYIYSFNGGPFIPQSTYTDLAAGIYTFQIMDANGFVYDLPVFVITGPTAPLQANFQLTTNDLNINATGGYEPYMYSIDGGLTFQEGSIFNDLPIGTYTVVVKDDAGCMFEGQVEVTVSAAGEQMGNLQFEVTPNPSEGLFLLKMEVPNLTDFHLEVYDVVGKRVFASQLYIDSGQQIPLELTALTSGTYFLWVRSEEVSGVKKLVIMR